MRKIARRQFMQSLAVTMTAPSIISAFKRPKRLPIAFSTLGCPKWEWKVILEQAAQLGYAGIELRGIQGEMDLTKRPEFSDARLNQSLKDLEALDLRITDLGSSARLHEFEPAKRAAQLDEAKRFIDLAHRLKAPYVRVFGDKFVEDQPRRATMDRIIAGLRELGAHAQGSGVTVLLESHGDFTDAHTLRTIIQSVYPNAGLLWDAHHTVVAGKEDPAHTFKIVGLFVRHTHLKDSKPDAKGGVRYVLTGTGTVPVRETVRVLVAGGYRGYYCFEWEKAWHPEIEEPEVAIPHFAKTIREYLAEAGVKAEG